MPVGRAPATGWGGRRTRAMRNSDTYKGFVYQKKCAFVLLLRELADQTDLTAFRMEHPNGDDVDLVYPTAMKVFQTKDVQTPNMAEYLAKMWRRYTENIRPAGQRAIGLGFIFSLDHTTDPCFCALKSGRPADASLAGIVALVNADGLTQVRIRDQAEWEDFLRPIGVQVLPIDQLEQEMDRSLGLIFFQYRLAKTDIDTIGKAFLGRLDEVMQNGREVPTNEVWEVIDDWFVRLSQRHPLVRQRTHAVLQSAADQLAYPDTHRPSISGSGAI